MNNIKLFTKGELIEKYYWNDPEWIECNDYFITEVVDVAGEIASIKYNKGASEAQVSMSEILNNPLLCVKCKSPRIEALYWVDLNTKEVNTQDGDDRYWCENCQKYHPLKELYDNETA